MEFDEQQQKFRALAAEAEELAAKSINQQARDNWHSVGESYRASAKALHNKAIGETA